MLLCDFLFARSAPGLAPPVTLRTGDRMRAHALSVAVALAMTVVVDRVMWVYEYRDEDLEIDLREQAKLGQQATNTYNSV